MKNYRAIFDVVFVYYDFLLTANRKIVNKTDNCPINRDND